MIASKNKIRLNSRYEAVIFEVISPDDSAPSKFLLGVFARPTARDELVKSVCHREIEQFALKGYTKWTVDLSAAALRGTALNGEVPIARVIFAKDPKSVDAGRKVSSAKNDSIKVGAEYEINNGLLGMNGDVISKLGPLVRDNSSIRAICGIGQETFTRRSMLVPHARAEKWHKIESGLDKGFWMAEGKLSALKDPAVRAEFIRRNKDVSGVSERQARIFELTCADDPAYHKAFLVYVGVTVSASESARPVMLREKSLLVRKKGDNRWKIIRPGAVLTTNAGVPENIPVIHVLSYKDSKNKGAESGNNPAKAEQDGDMKLNWVKLADKSWAIELDMSVAEQANQEKDKPQEIYKNTQMIAKVIKKNEGTADAATKQARLFEVSREGDPSYHATLLACVNVSDSDRDGACKATKSERDRLGAYNNVKLQKPYPILTNSTGATKSVPITHAVMRKTTKSVDNTPNAEDASELNLRWVTFPDNSRAVDVYASFEVFYQKKKKYESFFNNPNQNKKTREDELDEFSNDPKVAAAVIKANKKRDDGGLQARAIDVTCKDWPDYKKNFVVAVPDTQEATESARLCSQFVLRGLRKLPYNAYDLVGYQPAVPATETSPGKISVTHVLLVTKAPQTDVRHQCVNGFIGLNRDIVFRLVRHEIDPKKIKTVLGMCGQTFIWVHQRPLKIAFWQRGNNNTELCSWPVYIREATAVQHQNTCVLSEPGVGKMRLLRLFADAKVSPTAQLSFWKESGADCCCICCCPNCKAKEAIPAHLKSLDDGQSFHLLLKSSPPELTCKSRFCKATMPPATFLGIKK
ncbi:hypothetical protein FACS1894198_3110 [Clostridia bacterium]|nr:hypothetical protein FACS1894198_3110 [Clostridia bacterium]